MDPHLVSGMHIGYMQITFKVSQITSAFRSQAMIAYMTSLQHGTEGGLNCCALGIIDTHLITPAAYLLSILLLRHHVCPNALICGGELCTDAVVQQLPDDCSLKHAAQDCCDIHDIVMHACRMRQH